MAALALKQRQGTTGGHPTVPPFPPSPLPKGFSTFLVLSLSLESKDSSKLTVLHTLDERTPFHTYMCTSDESGKFSQ